MHNRNHNKKDQTTNNGNNNNLSKKKISKPPLHSANNNNNSHINNHNTNGVRHQNHSASNDSRQSYYQQQQQNLQQHQQPYAISSNNSSPEKSMSADNNQAKHRTQSIYEFLNNAIHEYLLKRNYHHTLECFKDETTTLPSTSKKNYNDHASNNANNSNLEAQLFEAFDKGNRELFFSKWNKYVPHSYKDEYKRKLEFYFQVYFVVYPIHPYIKKPLNSRNIKGLDKNELLNFKTFLETKGHELAQTSEFLQYYALPYVQNPIDHPSFRQIFTKEWATDIRVKLTNFLASIASGDKPPTLYQMYIAYTKNTFNNNEDNNITNGTGDVSKEEEYINVIANLESSNKELMNILQEFNEKYGALLKNYNALQKNEEIARTNFFESQSKWISFSRELITIINDLIRIAENQKQGIPIQDKVIETLKSKAQGYEGFLNANIEELIAQSQDPSIFDKFNISQEDNISDNSSISPHNQILSKKVTKTAIARYQLPTYPVLNFEAINKCLTSEQNHNVLCALLQALRWRITKQDILVIDFIEFELYRTKGAASRREVIISYAKHDILEINKPVSNVLNRILIKLPINVKEFSSRFINALASDYYGRSYLLQTDKLILLLINILKSETNDTVIRRNSLGALQQLSLRKKPQLIMINYDMIKWIMDILKNEKHTLSEYSYEYATALFMNLSLRSLGKKKCEDLNLGVLATLNDLLEHENLQVRTFVNGTLYSLLSRSKLKEQAKALGMADILEYLMENSDERFRKQLHYIIEQLNNEKNDDDDMSDDNEDENDVDDMDDDDEIGEDEETEEKIEDNQVLTGESLLSKHFTLTGAEALKQTKIVSEAIEESKSHRDLAMTNNQNRQNGDGPINRPLTPSMVNKMMGNEAKPISPYELQSRPKILRTPIGQNKVDQSFINGSAKSNQTTDNTNIEVNENRQSFNNFSPNQQKNLDSNVIDEQINEDSSLVNKALDNTDEYRKAFEARPKVLRTPPNGQYNYNLNTSYQHAKNQQKMKI